MSPFGDLSSPILLYLQDCIDFKFLFKYFYDIICIWILNLFKIFFLYIVLVRGRSMFVYLFPNEHLPLVLLLMNFESNQPME